MKGFIHQNDKKSLAPILLSTILFLTASTSQAAFQLLGPQDEEYHGLATNESFRRAVESEEPLDASDRHFLNNVEEKRTTNRSYYRIQLARPSVKLKEISNKSPGI